MSALLTIESRDETLTLLCLNHHLSLVADLPLESVTDITLLTAKKFEAKYDTITKEIVDIDTLNLNFNDIVTT